jgi:hypothetical protein
MEPATHDDCWSNYLNYRPELAEKLKFIAGAQKPTADHMIGNLWYGCAMARIRYVRAPRAMPSNNPLMLTQYWKQYYNTALGAGTIDQALPHFAAAVDLGTQLH